MWEIVGDSTLRNHFENQNIWSTPWSDTGTSIVIENYWPHGRESDLHLRIWSVKINNKEKLFAAGEAGGMERWVFALRLHDIEDSTLRQK